MRTSSLWGTPPSRYYRLLRRMRELPGAAGPQTLAVLGCADGKFVLPAARSGMSVVAIDRDDVALFGGTKQDASGTIDVPGLAWRLQREGLTDRVTVIHGDFIEVPVTIRADTVLTSGAFQYSFNTSRDLAEMVDKVGDWVRGGGLYYIDYMLPYEDKYKGRPNCPDAMWWREHFRRSPHWQVGHHKVMPPTIDRAHVEYPVDHYHQWGHILAQRLVAGGA